MRINNLLASVSKRILLFILSIIIILVILFYLWEKIKFSFVKNKISDVVITQTNGLYTVKYDSLFFNELTGEAFLKNIRIIPDTLLAKSRPLAELPYVLLDVSIKSITIKGVKTDKAIIGSEIIGDTIIINSPKITAWFLKPIRKETKIDAEAKEVYRQILGKLDLIKVGYVNVKDAEVTAFNFFNHYHQFDINNTNIDLRDVRIDSLHSEDTSRILFCKDALFHTDQFTSYNDNRKELNVKEINFSGQERKLSFLNLLLNRFEGDDTTAIKLMEAKDFFISGINTFEIVKKKNIFIDSILCKHILFSRPSSISLNPKKKDKEHVIPNDTAGFRKAYSLELRNIYFPDIDVLEPPGSKNNFKLGKFVLNVRGIKADEIMEVQQFPLAHIHEVDLFCNNISYRSNDNLYDLGLQNIRLNSLLKKLSVSDFSLSPLLGEEAFAKKARIQKDRYDINLEGISLNDINLDRLLDKQVVGDNITVNRSNIKIYRDISYPLEPVNKIGNSPSEMLIKYDVPVNIKQVNLNNTYLEYKEKNPLSGKAGTVNFEQGRINISNVTNITSGIKLNNVMTANYQTKVLGLLPLNTTFKFFLDAGDGKFAVEGTIGGCDAKALNQISVPMAMIRVDTGSIENAKFNFTGNDNGAQGEFVMRYKDFKIALLKKGEENKTVKKRGVLSFLANTLVKNENPHKGTLRSFTVQYDRDRYKSFFNLVWKAVFTGMKGTFGMPTGKIK